MYQTILTDLDGTVLSPVNTVPRELVDYLKVLRERGVRVFAVTGRTYKEAWDVLPDDFPIEGMVTANGMAVYAGQKKILQHALPEELVTLLITKAEHNKLYYELHPISGGRVALERDKRYILDQIQGDKPDAVHLNEWLSRIEVVSEQMIWKDDVTAQERGQLNKIYFFNEHVDQMKRWINELESIRNRIPFNYFSSTHNNVEVNVDGISKASGIQHLLQHYQLPLDAVLAVGDGENDLPMFEIAGHAAAMKNAPDHVKKHADEVTEDPNSENGLYRFLKKVFG